MNISKIDVLWSYGATFFKIASSALLLPLILKVMPSEMVGIWTIFMTITAFSTLLDFGFNPSFTRNITYVFSGVKNLKITGFEVAVDKRITIDYGLLKGVIKAMVWFYFRISLILFLLLITLGTYYIYTLLKSYNGDQNEVYFSWFLLCLINTYNLFTLYYNSLLLGKGLIKRSKQIIILGQLVYLIIASILIYFGFGLVAIVSAQLSSVIIIRWLSYNFFYTKEIKKNLNLSVATPKSDILKTIYPNAFKIGLTSIGGFMVQKSALIIGSLYLRLDDIAAYGVTMQLIAVISGLGSVYITTYQPKIVQLRVLQDFEAIKKIYIRGQLIFILTYLLCGTILLFLGNPVLAFLDSQTQLLPFWLLLLALILSIIETNLSIAGAILLTKNEVPFFKASLISGFLIILGLLIAFEVLEWGFYSIILVPLIVDVFYQAWKWPIEVKRDLKINILDYFIIKSK